MLTMLYALDTVVGAELILAGCAGSALACLGVCLLFRANRSRAGLRTLLLALGLAGAVCDLVWFLYFFPGLEYRNGGLAGGFALLLWPGALLVAGTAATCWNGAREGEH